MVSMLYFLASRGLWIVSLLAVDQDLAAVGRTGPREALHQCRLAGAVAADEAQDLAGVEVDGDVIDGVDAAEGDLDVAHLDERVSAAVDIRGPGRLGLTGQHGLALAGPGLHDRRLFCGHEEALLR